MSKPSTNPMSQRQAFLAVAPQLSTLPAGPLTISDVYYAIRLATYWRVLRHNIEAEALEARAAEYAL